MSTYPITYVLVLPTPPQPEVYSPFQWFSDAILKRSPTILEILRLPAHPLELVFERDQAIVARLRGGAPFYIEPLQVDALEGLLASVLYPFVCVISDRATAAATVQLVAAAQRPVLHLCAEDVPGLKLLAETTRADLLDYCASVKTVLERHGVDVSGLPFPTTPPLWPALSLRLEAGAHPVALPNEAALESIGLTLPVRGTPPAPFAAGQGVASMNEPYVRLVLASADALAEARAGLLTQACRNRARLGVDAILTAPGVLPQFLARRVDRQRGFPAILRQLLRQRHYRHVDGPPSVMRHLATPEGAVAVAVRREELAAYSAALAVRAAGHVAPVYRLAPGVNRVRTQLADLAACSASRGSNKPRRLSRLARGISQTLLREVPGPILERLADHTGGIKLVSDAPLEFLPIGDVPLCLRRVTSRVPVTPGNLLMSQMLAGDIVHVTAQEVRQVLVLRSLAESDPVRDHFKKALRAYMSASDHGLALTWRDVATVDEFVDACNGFSGSVLLFDGHGGHSSPEESGTLFIGRDRLDPASLRRRARVPPIVILSSCDGARLDRSHATTASAFLMLGAKAVMGTLAPVASRHAAVFAGRLLLRIADYLPVVVGHHGLMQWSEFMTGLMRMSYVTDLLKVLGSCGGLVVTADQFREIHTRANSLINSFDERWLEETIELIAAATGNSPASVEQRRMELAYFTETLLYVHLGWPEDVFVVGDQFGALAPSQ